MNGTALKAAGIDGPRTFAQHSEIVCGPDGTPTGHLAEHAAMDLMTPVLPALPYAERRDRLVALLTGMAATGLTSAHVMDLGGHDVPGLLAAIEEDGDLPLRLRLAPGACPAPPPRSSTPSYGSRSGPAGCGGSAG